METTSFGKKVFFLYPHSVIESDLIDDLIRNEYEVYTLKDYKKVKLLLKKYHDSILFINIDEVLDEREWFEFSESIIKSEELKGVQIGIVTYNENEELAQKYLMELFVPCGFIQLKLGKDQSRDIILKTLEANESKGQRKYIRATSTNDNSATFNVNIKNEFYTGYINDISSVGMSCVFDTDITLMKNTMLRKIQLKLYGKLVLVDGIVFGSRKVDENKLLFVVMFTNSLSDDNKAKIHNYIGKTLQEQLITEINQIYN